MISSTLSKIRPEKPSSYKNKVFLTFDIDWAHDEIIKNTIDILEEKDVKATFFVTHNSKVLERLRENHNFELGIHPNFNFLLDKKSPKGDNSKKILEKILDIVPEAKVIRSHSLTQSERLLDLFSEYGLSHVSNTYIPFARGIKIKPWRLWSDIIILPHFFQDNVELKLNKNYVTPRDIGLEIYDFHPIHIYLNSENTARYEKTRPFHRKPEILKNHINNMSFGTESILKKIMKRI